MKDDEVFLLVRRSSFKKRDTQRKARRKRSKHVSAFSNDPIRVFSIPSNVHNLQKRFGSRDTRGNVPRHRTTDAVRSEDYGTIEEQVELNDEFLVSFDANEKRGTSHKERREKEEKNWSQKRESILNLHVTYEFQRIEDTRARKEYERSKFEQNIAKYSYCQRCGARECDMLGGKTAWIISLEFCHQITFPILRCQRCKQWGEIDEIFHATPIHIGAFPCTPVWAFNLERVSDEGKVVMYSYELLEFLRDTVDFCPRLGIDTFARSLVRRIEKNECFLPVQPDTVRKQLGKAFQEYTVVETILQDQGMYFSNNQPEKGFSECPACQGSQEYLKKVAISKISKSNSMDSINLEENHVGIMHSIYIDGHFGIPHLAAAGKATQFKPPMQKKLFSDDEVKSYLEEPATRLPGERSTSCADFSADSMLARTSKMYDRTGILGGFCRHGSLIVVLNMLTGEKWGYATMVLHYICKMIALPLNLWYDINCRYKFHAMAWAKEKTDVLGSLISDWICNVMGFPLPSFHGSMHDANCQMNNSYRTILEAGLGTGEPPEYAWSHMRRAGHILQYQSLPVRAVNIERLVLLWNASRKRQIMKILTDAYQRTDIKISEQQANLKKVFENMKGSGASAEQISELMENRPVRNSALLVASSDEVDYLEATCIYKFIEKSHEILRPSVELLLGKKIGQRLSLNSEYAKKLKLKMDKARSQLPEGWGGVKDYAIGFAALWTFKLRQQEAEVIELCQQLHILEIQLDRLRTRRRETRRLVIQLRKQKIKIRESLRTMATIVGQLLLYVVTYQRVVGHAYPRNEKQGIREAFAIRNLLDFESNNVNVERLFEAVKEGQYPWLDANGPGDLEKYRVSLHMGKDILQRAEEEKKLLEEEIRGCHNVFNMDLQKLDEEIASQKDSMDVLESNVAQGCSQQTYASYEQWETGVEKMSDYTKLCKHKWKLRNLMKLRRETWILLQQAESCIDKLDSNAFLDTDIPDDVADAVAYLPVDEHFESDEEYFDANDFLP